MNVPREGSGLNQWLGLHLLLHSGGKSLMQCTAAIELLIVLNDSGMPAGGFCASAPVVLVGFELLNHGHELVRTEQRFDQKLHGIGIKSHSRT
jgi:hypothetical protein